jgi:hypothetical protein
VIFEQTLGGVEVKEADTLGKSFPGRSEKQGQGQQSPGCSMSSKAAGFLEEREGEEYKSEEEVRVGRFLQGFE